MSGSGSLSGSGSEAHQHDSDPDPDPEHLHARGCARCRWVTALLLDPMPLYPYIWRVQRVMIIAGTGRSGLSPENVRVSILAFFLRSARAQ